MDGAAPVTFKSVDKHLESGNIGYVRLAAFDAGTPDALQKRGDRTGRAQLADQIDLADIDAEFERGGRDKSF